MALQDLTPVTLQDLTPVTERLKGTGLAPKAVIAACMHKLLRQIYGVVKSRNAFDAQFLGNRLDFQEGI